MPEVLNQLLADPAAALVQESFKGVEAEWWWERRLDGGIVVCQVLRPDALTRELASKTDRPSPKVRKIVLDELGLEDLEPVVLTFELPGTTETRDASRALVERSRTPAGLAANLLGSVEEAVREG